MRWFSWFTGVWMVGYLLSAIFMGAWALFDAVTEPTDEQIYYVVASHLNREDTFMGWERLSNLSLRHDGGQEPLPFRWL